MPLRILVVEDHLETCTLLSRLLKANGHTVLSAHSAAEAVAAVEAHPIDLMLSDLSLPDRSGLDLMRELRQRPNPVVGIALTGMDAAEYRDSCREAGFASYLMKPLDLSRLLAEIKSVVTSPPAGPAAQAHGQVPAANQ